ncbi:PadR family transcriptional regulator [Paenibacillus dokdonensis]|uniref:PadR family transcriptional regulator n=2 Tax=Paenibacillus dokdonensis TaxID=2567944 RepID=A0ABU6GRG9_9BACL|nr:PadR family transcriptional regulator [Paenibacillus dokdonensis]MEC0242345.1 PadR family transcriptional regulator [Paenibacillus dokdonensis]
MLPLTEAFYYILIALYKEPSHGYGIMQDTEKLSHGRVKIGAGTLYTALNTLLNKGLIDHYPVPEGTDSRRKMYEITEDGKMVVAAEIERLEELLKAGQQVRIGEKECGQWESAWRKDTV